MATHLKVLDGLMALDGQLSSYSYLVLVPMDFKHFSLGSQKGKLTCKLTSSTVTGHSMLELKRSVTLFFVLLFCNIDGCDGEGSVKILIFLCIISL